MILTLQAYIHMYLPNSFSVHQGFHILCLNSLIGHYAYGYNSYKCQRLRRHLNGTTSNFTYVCGIKLNIYRLLYYIQITLH